MESETHGLPDLVSGRGKKLIMEIVTGDTYDIMESPDCHIIGILFQPRIVSSRPILVLHFAFEEFRS